MKNLSILACLVVLFSGCATTSPDKTALATMSLRVATSTGATLSLSKNPTYVPAAVALVAGLDEVLKGSLPITADSISAFIGQITVKHGMKPEESALLVNLARTVYDAYIKAYNPKIVLTSDPQAQLYIRAFRDGLADAIATLPK